MMNSGIMFTVRSRNVSLSNIVRSCSIVGGGFGRATK
jgi:hypothetical protein